MRMTHTHSEFLCGQGWLILATNWQWLERAKISPWFTLQFSRPPTKC